MEVGPVSAPLRLPSLRRPLGWRDLDGAAVEERALVSFFLHYEAVPLPRQGDLDTEPTTLAEVHANEWDDSVPATPRRSQSDLWFPLALCIVLVGFAPWPTWAPLLAGLVLGIILIRGGWVRRWVESRRSQTSPDSPYGQHDLGVIERRLDKPGRSIGWLLVVALVVLIVLMLGSVFVLTSPNTTDSRLRVASEHESGAQQERQGTVSPVDQRPSWLDWHFTQAGKDQAESQKLQHQTPLK